MLSELINQFHYFIDDKKYLGIIKSESVPHNKLKLTPELRKGGPEHEAHDPHLAQRGEVNNQEGLVANPSTEPATCADFFASFNPRAPSRRVRPLLPPVPAGRSPLPAVLIFV